MMSSAHRLLSIEQEKAYLGVLLASGEYEMPMHQAAVIVEAIGKELLPRKVQMMQYERVNLD